MSYKVARLFLVIVIATSIFAIFVNDFDIINVGGLFLGICALLTLMYTSRDRFSKLYEEREAYATRYRYSHMAGKGYSSGLIAKYFNKDGPNKAWISDFAPGCLICGPFVTLFGYFSLLRPERPSRMPLRQLYDLTGPHGEAWLWCFAGIFITVYGAEVLIGRRLLGRVKPNMPLDSDN